MQGVESDQILLFEEETYNNRVLLDFLGMCGLEVTVCEEPSAVVRFARAMDHGSGKLLVLHLGDITQIGMVLAEKIRLVRTVPLDRVLIVLEGKDAEALARIRRLGYPNVMSACDSAMDIARAMNRALYKGESSRKLVRVFVRLPGDVTFHKLTVPVLVTNLCEGGAFFECARLLPNGSDVDLHLVLGPGEEIRGKGVVVFSQSKLSQEVAGTATKKGMGLRFTDLGDAARSSIEEFLKRELARAFSAGERMTA